LQLPGKISLTLDTNSSLRLDKTVNSKPQLTAVNRWW